MDNSELLDDLVTLLEQNGVEIRRMPMGGKGGGLCRIKDRSIFYVDTECSIIEMLTICAKEVNCAIDIDAIYLRPQLREILEKYS